MARVLVADDEEGCREILETVLEGEHEVRTVASGRAALEVAAVWAPDVAILDLTLDGVSGVEIARQLQGRVRAVAFTGWGMLSGDHQALFKAVLTKPALPAEIRRVVSDVLNEP